MVRVLLAIAHPLLRAALQEYLLVPGEFMCGEAGTCEELWDQLIRHEWTVLVLDICLSQHTKVQTVRRLRALYPGLPILVTSFSVGVACRYWAEAGASGFVPKRNLSTDLAEAVRVISRGGTYFADEYGVEKRA